LWASQHHGALATIGGVLVAAALGGWAGLVRRSPAVRR
jgi:hypothetical protein